MNTVKNEYWESIIDDFRQSGKTIKEYALENGIKDYTLGYWNRKRETKFSGFIEANNNPSSDISTVPVQKISITTNNIRIETEGDFDDDLLLRLIKLARYHD